MSDKPEGSQPLHQQLEQTKARYQSRVQDTEARKEVSTMTTQPMQDDVMHELKDMKGELGDIKCQLAKSNKAFNKALYQTPLAFGTALVATGVALRWGDWMVFFGVGVAAMLYSLVKIGVISRRKVKEN